MILATTAITVSWPMLAAIAAVSIAVVKFGDRLWGRMRNNGNAYVPRSMDARVAKLEEHAKNTNDQLKEIKKHLSTISDRLFDLGRER